MAVSIVSNVSLDGSDTSLTASLSVTVIYTDDVSEAVDAANMFITLVLQNRDVDVINIQTSIQKKRQIIRFV